MNILGTKLNNERIINNERNSRMKKFEKDPKMVIDKMREINQEED